MQLKFNASLSYQINAVKSVIDLFSGQEIAQRQFEISSGSINTGVLFNEKAVSNNLTISDDDILKNLRKIQYGNELPKSDKLSERSFSIEMETGTGKTYIYLRSIFELNKNYGFQKFIIVVPGIAVREGVLNSIKSMSEHFKGLYNNVPFSSFIMTLLGLITYGNLLLTIKFR